MLVVAALVPDTVLLVPGAGGTSDPASGLREAALRAVGEVTASGVRSIVVVAPGGGVDRVIAGTVRTTLGAAGIPDGLLGWPVVEVQVDGVGSDSPGAPVVVALHLLARTGWGGALRIVEVTSATAPDGLADLGADLVGTEPTGMVVVGSGSGRHGPDAPLADDPRAPDHDARVLADLADADPAARARLAADDPALADELAVRGWAPWQVLVGAAGDATVRARTLAASTDLGAQHAVLLWDAR
ncbi:hypothetical protein [Cellulomonas sp.]|uniref:hypothetical protein n=1 Tax=Cellulomonas sp. TaxID=40001 RepID=UPI003BAD0B10